MANYPFPGGPLVDEPKGGTSNDLVDLDSGGGILIDNHELDGDTQILIGFNGVGTDASGNLNHVSTGTIYYTNMNGLNDDRQGAVTWITAYNAGNEALSQANTEMTVAFWLVPYRVPANNCAIVGFRGPGAGSTNNFPWTVDYQTSGKIVFRWQSGTKVNEDVISVTSPTLGVPVHVVATRTAAETEGEIYFDGVLDKSETLLTAHNDGAAQTTLRFLHDGNGNELQGALSSVIVKDVHVDAAAALALYNEALA